MTKEENNAVEVPAPVAVDAPAKKKMKRKSPGKDTRTVLLRLTVAQKNELIKKSEAAGKSLNLFILGAIESARVMPKTQRNKDLQDLNAWLGRLNSNINMLSKHANTYKAEADAVLMHVRLAQIRQDLQTLVDGVLK
ncbi:hypothetical protein [Pseudomonas serbica]|uniref:hypothetical protein n=1 Tax=Pseudomonas serbica TaxID=2965074 RepID=UPI00237AB2F0|nr:hypothetical protein [Pseudomonas serbica]